MSIAAPIRRWFAAALALAACAAAAAQTVAPAPAADARSLEAAFDKAFGPGGSFRYTGAVVAVVQDGRIVFTKGYGHEDGAGKIAVDPAVTRFRLGSITKTLTAASVAQLIDKGAIKSVDDPVNRYLTGGLVVPDNGGKAITLRMLATHQAGFAEGRTPDLRPGDRPQPLDAAYVQSHLPGYLVPVNGGSNYSNFGATLLGVVVQDVSGEPYKDYIARHVFAPLGMATATIIDAPGQIPHLAEAQALYPNGGVRTIPNDFAAHPMIVPAGGFAATATDMARYMIGLTGGSAELGIPAIVSDKARGLMFSRLGGTGPLVQGYGILFMNNRWNGETIVEHGGRVLGASSYMTLVPSRRIGIFVSATGEAGTDLPLASLLGLPGPVKGDPGQAGKPMPYLSTLRSIGVEALLGRYRLPFAPDLSNLAPASDYAGDYVGQRRALRSVSRIFSDTFLGGPLPVRAGPNGSIMIGRGTYVPVARDVFWRDPALTPDKPSGWSDLIVFRRGADGTVRDFSYLYTDVVFARATGPLTPSRTGLLLAAGAATLLTGLFAVLWARRARGRILAPVLAVMVLASPIVFFRSWPKAPTESLSYIWIRSSDLVPFQIWTNLTALAAAALIGFAVLGIVRPAERVNWRTWLARWHLRLLAVGAVCLLLAYAAYDMIGWNVG